MTRQLSRSLCSCFFFIGLLACSSDDAPSDEDASSGEDASIDQDASSEEDASTDQDAGSCDSGEATDLDVTIELPSGVSASVIIYAANGELQLFGSERARIPAGEVTIRAFRVTTPGELVGRAYYPMQEESKLCVREGQENKLTITYELEPGSEKLWVLGGDDYHTASYAATDLTVTGEPTPAATLSGSTTAPSSLAFDRKGNLWIADTTGKVLRYARDSLGRSDEQPDVVLEGADVCADVLPCGPRALAFDREGNLWLALPRRVVRIGASELAQSGEPPAEVTISGASVEDPQSLAFDASGALWVGDWKENSVVRFDQLNADYAGAPVASLLGQRPPPVVGRLGGPASLAFDPEGNLWVGYFGPNIIARYTPEEQGTVGEVTPVVQLQIGALALIEGMAFDEAGNLWLTGKFGQVARLASSVLASSDTNLDEGAVFLTIQGSAQDVAFNSPPSGTPIAR